MKAVGRRASGVGRWQSAVGGRQSAVGSSTAQVGRRARGAVTWLAACVLLAACGTTPKAPQRVGGYYQGDGPPEKTPVDLAGVPDAVPRVEPLHPFANRPYVALGRRYTPLAADVPFRSRGLASWYGRQFHGNRTSSGEIYDMFAMTAAHPTLPIPSFVRVTGVKSGASVIVRVNDRGPFKDDRIIDLSYAAATRLGFANAGIGEVEIERLTNADIASGRCCARTAVVRAAPVDAPPASTPPANAGPEEPVASAVAVAEAGASAAAPLPDIAGAAPAPVTAPPSAARWSVQLGAFSQAARAEALRDQIAAQLAGRANALPDPAEAPRVERHGSIFRVLIGDLVDRAAALALAQRLERFLGRETAVFSR